MATSYEVRTGLGGQVLVGIVRECGGGWKFFPRQAGRRPSTALHYHWQAAVPRWAQKYLGAKGETRKVEA